MNAWVRFVPFGDSRRKDRNEFGNAVTFLELLDESLANIIIFILLNVHN